MRKRDLILFSNRPTDGGRLLADKLNARYLRERNRRRVRRTEGALEVNWGAARGVPEWLGRENGTHLLNDPESVSRATSKIRSYEAFQQAGIPTFEFTTKRSEADEWRSTGTSVLGRRDGASGGAGISVYQGSEHIGSHEFYTRYYPKTHEYRVHVFRGKIIDVTQKRRRSDPVQIDEDDEGRIVENGHAGPIHNQRTLEQRIVRSLDNGWVHCHDNIHLLDSIRATSTDNSIGTAVVRSVDCLDLDFGAVDVLVRCSKKDPNKIKDFKIAEVNTAPGLANEVTLEAYKKAILEYYEETSKERYVPRIRKVRKLVRVQIITRKGNKVWREQYRYVSE